MNNNLNELIKFEKVSKEYNSGKAVNEASFSIEKGRIYGLVGPNGAGKTTIMRMMGGLVYPTEGKIITYENGEEVDNDKARKKMSFIIEYPYLNYKMTARENLEKFRILYGIKDKEIVDELLKLVGLGDIDKKKIVKKYSLGMKQRLGIAISLMNNPEVLVLDEPINGLDPEGIIEIRKLILKLNRDKGITIIISSHILSELSHICTDYYFINHGKIIKEITKDQLKKECQDELIIKTDDDQKAIMLLESYLNNSVLSTEDGIHISDYSSIRDISKYLFDNQVIPVYISTEAKNLEEYYLSVIGDLKNDK